MDNDGNIPNGVENVIIRKLQEIEKMVNGNLRRLGDELEIRGVSIDSRTIEQGSLFIPIVRIKDGHDFVEEAITRGAAASLWQADHPNAPQTSR